MEKEFSFHFPFGISISRVYHFLLLDLHCVRSLCCFVCCPALVKETKNIALLIEDKTNKSILFAHLTIFLIDVHGAIEFDIKRK